MFDGDQTTETKQGMVLLFIIWLSQVLVVTCGTFDLIVYARVISCGMGVTSLIKEDWTKAPTLYGVLASGSPGKAQNGL